MMFPAALKLHVSNRGTAPDSFLSELVAWAQTADESVYAPNPNPFDVFALVRDTLGPWQGLAHRRAALCEVMRVHAGFESSWRWSEGVDVTNATSQHNPEGQETGIFQVSHNSIYLASGALTGYARQNRIYPVSLFIPMMKQDHHLALDYYAHLVRVNIAWAGPLIRGEILPWLSRDAVAAFESLLEEV